MRKILIVGAGQSGLCLAHGLLDAGYEVTVATARPTAEIRTSAPGITQFTMPQALAQERRLGLDFWSTQAPPLEGVGVSLRPSGTAPVRLEGRFQGTGMAVDARVKMADWLEYFEDRGGNVVIHGLTLSDLDYLTRMFELTVVAVGGGELGALFSSDPDRFSGAHERVITQVLVDEAAEETHSGTAEVLSAPEGRGLLAPVLTPHGPAFSVCAMDTPGGILDGSFLTAGSRRHPDAGEVTGWITETLTGLFPEQAARLKGATPIAPNAALVRRVRPQVRHPVAQLPSGGAVLGLADVVVTTDPLAGQAWNSSTVGAATYLDRVRTHGMAPFDQTWMRETFEAFWSEHGHAGARLSHLLHHMWDRELPSHLTRIIAAAQTDHDVADRFVHGLDDPRDYTHWLYAPEDAHAYLARVGAASH